MRPKPTTYQPVMRSKLLMPQKKEIVISKETKEKADLAKLYIQGRCLIYQTFRKSISRDIIAGVFRSNFFELPLNSLPLH